jgi:hypothetical protein
VGGRLIAVGEPGEDNRVHRAWSLIRFGADGPPADVDRVPRQSWPTAIVGATTVTAIWVGVRFVPWLDQGGLTKGTVMVTPFYFASMLAIFRSQAAGSRPRKTSKRSR